MLVIPQPSFLKVIVGKQRLCVVLNADRQKDVVEALFHPEIESILFHDTVEDPVHCRVTVLLHGLLFVSRRQPPSK